uniref:Mic1 domain-containing protein n=1 Tax=Syphacia muris TaxID=451379 RepID=A0A0N5AH61_9BILA
MIDSNERFLVGKFDDHLLLFHKSFLQSYHYFCQSCIKWKVSASFFRLLLFELSESRVFERFVLCLARTYNLSAEQDIILKLRLLQPVYDAIDYKWNYRIGALLQRAVVMECLFWSLSTLGGAISAMADYISSFVDQAKMISLKQLQLAMHIGDPILISRCYLFIAMSLAQRKHYKTAIVILRYVNLNQDKLVLIL